MAKAYIAKNEKFELKSGHEKPESISVFYECNYTSQRYILTNFNILVIWSKLYSDLEDNTFQIIYKDVVLVSIIITQLQNIADYLNKFNTISKEELNKLYAAAQLNEKTELDLEIEKLKETKKELHEKMELFLEIESKAKELSELVEKLEN
ncbi:hypothetical protein ACFPH8_00300 [Bizionia hallyeonensis]|uniref:Uncharacterized protein n=1 Tax=Bizionia hallyeonensis TaxID=1123757 RepID=A0ABW0C2B1_9FLAO